MKVKRKLLLTMIIILVFSFKSSEKIFAVENEVSSFEEIVGKNRFETAIQVSNKFEVVDEIVLVNSNGIVDALAATPYAAMKNAPILLTNSEKLNLQTKNQIEELNCKRVTIIGGEGVISENIVKELKAIGVEVERIYGKNRYSTASEIAKKMGDIEKVAVVNGETGLVDALSLAAPAAKDKIAIILCNGDKILEGQEFVDNASTKYVIGGTAVISENLEQKIGAKRLYGSNRNSTNIAVLNEFYQDNVIDNLYLAKDGSNSNSELVDALSAGPLAGINKSPILLCGNKLIKEQIKFLEDRDINKISQVGGGISKNIISQIKTGIYEEVIIENPTNNCSKKGVFKDLGMTEQPFQINTGIMHNNNKGEKVMYAGTIVMGGNQCTFFSFNTISEKIEKMITIQGAEGIISMETFGDYIYFGTYNSAMLYRYNTKTEVLEKLCTLNSGDRYIWDIKPHNGRIYIGTSPRSRVYKYYENEKVLEDLGSFSNNQYARSVEYYNGNIYAGIGSRAELIEYNDKTKMKTNILPSQYEGQFVKYLKVMGDKMFITIYPSTTVLTYDFKTKEITERMDRISNAYYDYYPTFNENYITFNGPDGYIFHYNKLEDDLKCLQYNGNSMTSAGVINNQYICGINQDGYYFKNDLNGHNPKKINLRNQGLKGVGGLPVTMYPYNNKIYFGGKNLGVYDTALKKACFKEIKGEVKSIGVSNGYLYTGNYTDATIWKFNKANVDDEDVIKLTDEKDMIFETPKQDNQNRPSTMITNPKNNTITLASQPSPGFHGGTLTTYDATNGNVYTRNDVVKNHYINAMVYDNKNPDIVYLGSSSKYSYGSTSLNENALLVKYNIKTKSKLFEIIPENTSTRIASVAYLDNKIYCINDTGTITMIDANTGKILKQLKRLWYRQILASRDGNLYALNNVGFWKINQNTLEATLIRGNLKNPTNLNEDYMNGKIYFYNDYNLICYE